MTLAGNMKLKTFVGIAVVVVFGAGVLTTGAAVMLWPSTDGVEYVPPPASAVPGAAPAAPTAPPAAPATPTGNLTPVQKVVMGYANKDLGSKKLKDVSKGKPYKINVYQDDGQSTANRAKVDLNRNDRWDEKWTFDGDSVQRKVAPADDENYTEVYLWNGEDWAPE